MSPKKSPPNNSNTIEITYYALQRTVLAVERNAMAAIRTGFSAFALGFALLEFLHSNFTYVIFGWVLLALGGGFLLAGFVYYPWLKNKISDPPRKP